MYVLRRTDLSLISTSGIFRLGVVSFYDLHAIGYDLGSGR